MEWVRAHWPIIAFVVNGLLAWFLWSMAQKFATKADIAELKGTVSADVAGLKEKVGADVGAVSSSVATVRSRIDILEKEVDRLPTAAAMHEQSLRMERLIGAMEAVNKDYQHVLGRQTRLEDAMIRHENILSEAASQSRRGRP